MSAAGRLVALAFSGLAALGSLSAATPASAHDGATASDTDTADTTGRDTVAGAVVTEPGGTTRQLDQLAAETFVRSWFRPALAGQLAKEAPPAGAAQSSVDVELRKAEGAAKTMHVFFSVSGQTGWVSMPPQNLGWAVVDVQTWFRAPQMTLDAFHGKGVPVPSAGRRGGSEGVSTGRVAQLVLLSALCLGALWLLAAQVRGGRARPAIR